MRTKYLLLIVYLFSLAELSTKISFTSSGDGYTVLNKEITISTDGEYDLEDSVTNKKIIVSSSSTLNLNSFSLVNSGSLTPIVISSGKEVNLVLTGESTLTDSSSNEYDGTIYLESGATLKISGTGTLNINPNKFMAINGTDSTSLNVNDGPTINIQSSSSNVGGIYLRNSVTFNNAKFTYSCSNGGNHAIDTEGTIKLVKGTYNINAGAGKGIQSEGYLYIGEENGIDSDLTLNINTNNEGIEAKKIEIYSGNIKIEAGEDGINAASSGDDCDETVNCSGNCACYIVYKGGNLELTSGEDGIDVNGDITISGGKIIVFSNPDDANQPIDQDGLLRITGGTILAAGSSQMGGVSGQTTQTAKTYTGTIKSGAKLVAWDSSNNEIISLTTPKAANYLYFNYKSSFSITIDGTGITLSDATSSQEGPGGQGPPEGQGSPSDQGVPGAPGSPSDQTPNSESPSSTAQNSTDDEDPEVIQTSGYFLKCLNILFIFGLFIL